ncbi:MAG TPA: hypothetical protein DIW51_13345 [Rhodospirillaceae bacterium]|nr:hypothetical protein [Magnetovibrio sp.]HBT41706.1 hypothetical protein [Rhodospirillaceae bacterium]HCS70942.1 hypothetical protein [Rhodospirillaceae bacterium]|tara:strand:+ start:18357 stop:19241 length:885 start_codon:yes stop_codon:yes gene_type:complete
MKQTIKKFLRPLLRVPGIARLYGCYKNAWGDPRFLYLPATWWLAKTLVPRRRVRLGRVSFTLQCDNQITHFRWFLFGRKEPEIVRFIDNYTPPDGLFMDIGANIGVFSLYAGKRHENLRVVSVEPEFSNLHYLKENILCNGLSERVRIIGVAASDQDGLSSLHLHDTTPGAAVHSESPDKMERTAEGYNVVWVEGIATATVDSICANIQDVPAALKIDTDGNEVKVLAGARATLADTRLRAIAIELPPLPEDVARCHAMLGENGFNLAWSHESTRNEIWARTNTLEPASRSTQD